MNNKVVIAVVIILAAVVSFLAVQNFKLNKKVDELSATPKEEVKITPVVPETKPANPAGASPFDKPNVDPLASQFPEETPSAEKLTTIKFEKTEHDFGKINEGEVVHTVFKFTNTGKLPLLIASAQGSCGCTVPQWPRNYIKQGESGEISVQFDSHGKMGQVEKTVTVTANTHPVQTVLTIKSTIIPKDK